MSDRCVGINPPHETDRIMPGWTSVVSLSAVNVIFPVRHWDTLGERAEADIDNLCASIGAALRRQLKKEQA